MAVDRRRPERSPSQAEPTEAVERLLSRRQLIIQPGDIVISRQPGGVQAESRGVYQLHIHGGDPLLDRFASFQHAAAKGEELATTQRVRLFYVEHKNEPPALLKDARTSQA